MSALARYFKAAGKQVFGYDKTPSTITGQLEELGISIHYQDNPDEIPVSEAQREETLVVYTPAVPQTQLIFKQFQKQGFAIKKRAEVLGILSKDKYCLAVAGTHGKTTTSAILGHLLAECEEPVTAFLGGIAINYESNLIQQGEKVIVAEADEFDRSFMHLHPNIACISSVDADHLDIYGEKSALENAFRDFSNQLVEGGTLIIKKGLPFEGLTVAIDEEADFSVKNLRIIDGFTHFDLHHPRGITRDFELMLPGAHNIYNATTALAMAITYGIPAEKLIEPLAGFTGVNRRFTYRIHSDDLILIDDYAHHPTEINAVFESLKRLYPEDELLVVFQPHLFSRTRDFLDDFATSLSQFDALLLLDIYPAREEPIPGITSEALLARVSIPRKRIIAKEELLPAIKESKNRIVVMLGAGDIGTEILNVTKALSV